MISITSGYRRKVTATPTKRDGSPAGIDGILQGTALDGSVTVTPVAGDSLSVFINGTGSIGRSRVRLFADARIGPDVREVSTILDVDVIDEEASNLGLLVRDEEIIPADPTPAIN